MAAQPVVCRSVLPPGAGSAPVQVWHGIDLRWAYSDLLNGIRRRTGCAQRACDVLHDALLRFALMHRRAPIEKPHAYLRTVVSTVLADRHREQARWVELPGGAGCLEDAGEHEHALSAERVADLEQRLRAVQGIIDCLPPRCREVFWLFRIEGCSQKEVAAMLGISLKAVERQMTRALCDIMAAREELST